MTVAEVVANINRCKEALKELEEGNIWSDDLKIKNMMIKGYERRIAFGEQWVKENQKEILTPQ